MATHADGTRTPLLPPPGVAPPLLPAGSGRPPGPVTIAIAAMRAADPDAAPCLRARVTRRAWELFRLDRLAGFAAAMKAAWREARAVTPASAAGRPVEPLRALLVYDTVPVGCIAHPVTKDDLGPHLRPGEFAIIDPTDRDPIRGELYLVAWMGGSEREGTERLALVQAYQREHVGEEGAFTAWWVGSIRNRHSPETTTRLVAEHRWDLLGWSNGPYCPGVLEQQIRGRVVGVLATAFEEPRRIRAGGLL